MDSAGVEEIVFSDEQYQLLQKRSKFFCALYRHAPQNGGQNVSVSNVMLPCSDQATWPETCKILTILATPAGVSHSCIYIDIENAFNLAIYLQSTYLVEVLVRDFLSQDNCVKALIGCLNIVGPSDYTSLEIFTYLERNIGLTRERALEAATNRNPMLDVRYNCRRLSKLVRNFRRRNKRFWQHYPSNMKCIYCQHDISPHSITTGCLATVQMTPCCALLAHSKCLRDKIAQQTYPRCPICATYLNDEKHIDVDGDILHFVFKRLQIRDEYKVPRCYPHHHQCIPFSSMPPHKGSL